MLRRVSWPDDKDDDSDDNDSDKDKDKDKAYGAGETLVGGTMPCVSIVNVTQRTCMALLHSHSCDMTRPPLDTVIDLDPTLA